MIRRLGLWVILAATICTAQTMYDGKLGIELTAGESSYIGIRYHFTDMYCLRPNLGFSFGEGANVFGIFVDNNIYLPALPIIDHYINVGLEMRFIEDQDVNVNLPVGYGLQHQISETLGLFGSIGIRWELTAGKFSTVKSGAGIVLYLW